MSHAIFKNYFFQSASKKLQACSISGKFKILSTTLIRRQLSVPPFLGPLRPLPTICEYNTTENVGLPIITQSIVGSSNPVEKILKLMSTSSSPFWKSLTACLLSFVEVSPVTDFALTPSKLKSAAKEFEFSTEDAKTRVFLFFIFVTFLICSKIKRFRCASAPTLFKTLSDKVPVSFNLFFSSEVKSSS